ncbi:MAG: glycoside hydrolase family 3 protein, partial [Acidobacteriaceae bacterium]
EQKWADKMLKKLSLEEKIGQMIEVRGIMGYFNAEDPRQQQLVSDIRKYHLGAVHLTSQIDGVLLLRNGPYAAAMTTNILQQAAGGKVPLIFSVDFERGPSMRLSAVPAFPAAMAFGATHNPEYAERFGRIVAEESRAMGIEWNFFPVADVNANPKNPVINTRSFGEDPNEVSAMTVAYIRGSHSGGMLATAKHFPGHGDTDTDSHLDISRVNGDMARLNAVELPPFKADIAAGVDAVMIAHVAFPALEPDPNKVSTISHNVVTGLLRDQLGFKGVIVSDAMEMKGLTKLYPPGNGNPAGRAAVDAVKAGQDLLELPSDLDGTYNGLLQAAKSGEIPKAQIDASVRRILLVKAKVGLNKGDMVDVDQVQYHVGKPSSYALAQEVADHAVTLVKDGNHVLPMMRAAPEAGEGTFPARPAYVQQQQDTAGSGQAANLGAANPLLAVLFVDSVHGENGRMLERQIRARVPDAKVIYVDDRSSPLEADGIAALLPQYRRVIAAVYSIPHAGRAGVDQTSLNAMAMESTTGTVLQNILNKAGERTVVLAVGSPYTILDFPSVQTYLCTFSTAQTSEIAAVKALFGEIAIHGKLPVTLPDIAARGEGIDREISAPAASETGGRQ